MSGLLMLIDFVTLMVFRCGHTLSKLSFINILGMIKLILKVFYAVWSLAKHIYSSSLIVQITDFLEFLHEYCNEKSETCTKF